MNTLTDSRLDVIANKPKAVAADLPSLGEAVDMATELLLLREVREALERFVRAEKAWMDAKAPMELRAPGTFEDPLSDAYSHAVAVLDKLPRCHNLGPRVPMIQHERPTCGLFEGHGGDHSARCLNGQWLRWPKLP